MGIFGRNANQKSTKPDVPPELQPYFEGKSLPARIRRILSSAAPLIITLIIIAGVIAGGIWLLRGRSTTTKTEKPATTQSETQTGPSSSSSDQTSQTPTTTGGTAESTTTPTAATTDTTIPNTGPGETALIAAVSVAILGAAAYYIRQFRLLDRLGD